MIDRSAGDSRTGDPATGGAVPAPRHWWFEHRPPGTIEGYALIVFGTLSAVWAILVVGLGLGERLLLTTVYALPIVLAVSLALAVRLFSLGTSGLPFGPTLAGLLFIVGGVIFDLVATILHSPTLDREGNPVLRALLDSGHGLPFVYGYTAFAQTLLVATIGTLWLALLRHRDSLLETIGRHDSFWSFAKAATGGARLNWRQWIVPFRSSESPHPYQLFWLFVITFIAGTIDRWYVALDWFGVVPPVRWWVLSCGISFGLIGYFTWLRRATRPVLPRLDSPAER